MDVLFSSYLIIFFAVFFAGFIDSIAGGGGLISLPAYMAAGLPPHFALGNNKFSSCFGTLFATLRYHKARMIDIPVAILSSIFALIGSFTGSKMVLMLNPESLRYLLLVLLPLITIFVFFNKNLGFENKADDISKKTKFILAGLFSFVIGTYDGFFGPGTGSFLIFCYTLILKYDFVTANGNTKVVNLSSNIAALITFIINNKIIYKIAIPAVLFGITGNLLGTKIVIDKGNSLIRPIFIIIQILLFTKILYDLIVK